MDDKKGHSKRAFDQTRNPKQPETKPVPDMIKKERPQLKLKPPTSSITRDVDRKVFDQRWQQEVNKHRGEDGFDKVNQRRAERERSLTDRFNERAGNGLEL